MEWTLVIDLYNEQTSQQNHTFAPVEPEANPAEDDDQSTRYIDLGGHYKQE